MKKWMLILGVLIWTSCFDDKGNYDYIDLGEMTISGIATDRWYEAFAYSDTLNIPVKIESTRYKNGEEPYTYQWKLMKTNDETRDEHDVPFDYIISREKDLKVVPQLVAGDYTGFFIVTDTLLEVQQKVDFYLRLKTPTSEGWMILCEQEGETRLDWIIPLTDTSESIARDIWSKLDYKLGKPYAIASAYWLQGSNRYVFTERGTYNIDAEDAHVGDDNDVRWRFGDIPEVVHGLATEIAIQRNYRLDLLITRDKNLYVRNPSQVGSVYGFAVNQTADGKRFDVAPWVGHTYGGNGASVIIYDETNRRFMELDDNEVVIPHPLTFSSGGRVSFAAETGRDMVYMNWTKDGYTFAVLQDPVDRELYIYGIQVQDNGKNYSQYYMKLNRPNQDKVKYFAFHSLYRYLFYATENNEVYQFNMEAPDQPAKLLFSFPGEHITALRINKMVGWIAYQPWERARENQLVIGSYLEGQGEKECGVMRIYEVPSLMGPLVKKKEFTKLGKIVDIVYRERGK